MHVAGHADNLLSAKDVALLYEGALRIRNEMGMQVQSARLPHALSGAGLPVDPAKRVRFPAPVVECFVVEAERMMDVIVEIHRDSLPRLYG